MRVLHVVETLDRGAVENWLLRMLKHARERNIGTDWSFYCTLPRIGARESTAVSLDARVLYSPVPILEKLSFIRALRQELYRGQYDILHCHHDIVSAMYLTASLGIPLQRRIVHVHNADESIPTGSRFRKRVLREPMRHLCFQLADRIVGISNHTLDTFLAGRTRRSGRDSVHYYGVESAPFENAVPDREAFRRQLRLPDDARILLFGGRMVPEKNPVFAVEVLQNLRCIEPRAVGVFAGSGSEEPRVLERARELGLEDSLRVLGWRNDLAEIMSCSDWFILPHPEHPVEGFGLAVVEAQLAGLRMLLSRGILDDPLLPTASFRRLPLASGAQAWAEAAVALLNEPPPSRNATLAALRQSPFDMDTALADLVSLYQ